MTRVLVFALLCFIALCVGVYLSLPHFEISIGSFATHVEQQPETRKPEKDLIRFVGDVMLSRNVENLMNTYGVGYPFEALPMHPQNAFLVGNFEGTIPKVHVPTKSMEFAFSVAASNVQGLSSYGFTHLGLANNHSYDFGADDYEHAKELLSGSFTVFGDQMPLSYDSVALIQTPSSTIAIIGVYAVDTPPSVTSIQETLEYAESISTHQIAYVHWGTEYAPVHSASQQQLAHTLIDAGADSVIGHHPHVIQDIESYKGALIFYSLGNFIFDQYFSEEVQNGLMLELQPSEDMLRFTLIPVTSIGSRSQARFAGPYEKDVQLEELAKKSDPTLSTSIQSGYIESAF